MTLCWWWMNRQRVNMVSLHCHNVSFSLSTSSLIISYLSFNIPISAGMHWNITHVLGLKVFPWFKNYSFPGKYHFSFPGICRVSQHEWHLILKTELWKINHKITLILTFWCHSFISDRLCGNISSVEQQFFKKHFCLRWRKTTPTIQNHFQPLATLWALTWGYNCCSSREGVSITCRYFSVLFQWFEELFMDV